MLLGKDKSINVQHNFLEIAVDVAKKIPFKEKKLFEKLSGMIVELS